MEIKVCWLISWGGSDLKNSQPAFNLTKTVTKTLKYSKRSTRDLCVDSSHVLLSRFIKSSPPLSAEWLITDPTLFFPYLAAALSIPISHCIFCLPLVGLALATAALTPGFIHLFFTLFFPPRTKDSRKYFFSFFFSTEESHYSLLWFPLEPLGGGGTQTDRGDCVDNSENSKIAMWYFICATQMCHLSKVAPVFISRVKVRVRITQRAVCFTANGTTFLPFVHFKLLMHVCCFIFQRLQGSKSHVRVQRNTQAKTSQQRTLNPLFMASYSITV